MDGEVLGFVMGVLKHSTLFLRRRAALVGSEGGKKMVSRTVWIAGILILMTVALVPAIGFSAEHGGQEHGGSSTAAPAAKEHGGTPTKEHGGTPASPAQTPPAATQAPASVAPEIAIKPITITFSGKTVKVDSGATPAMIQVEDRYGVKKDISVTSEAKIMQGNAAKNLADLKDGVNVTVEYTYDVATGKRTAQTINVGEATAAGK